MINLYTTSTVGNYKTGTVTCTKNSPTVTGTGTTWKEIVNPGDILTLDDDKFYIISAVNSNTSLTLDKNFAENTATNVSYRILLNTAAHFPSDTAAKVERALEQLSDINEAAINNDRTVTAATKVNGKGIESTTGYINLNPPSINSNNGGSLRFHYNQASSATSKIYEDVSGRIRVDGKVYLNNHVVSGINGDSMATLFMPAGASNNYREFTAWKVDNLTDYSNDIRVGNLRMWEKSADIHAVDLYAQIPSASDSSTYIRSGVYCTINSNGTHTETLETTPATDNNSTQIATTAFVKNFYNANISRLIVNHYQLSGAGSTLSFNMQGNIAVVFAKRDSRSILMMFDTWNSAPTILSYTVSNTFLTGSMASNTVTLTHGGETGSLVIIAFTGINAGHWFN